MKLRRRWRVVIIFVVVFAALVIYLATRLTEADRVSARIHLGMTFHEVSAQVASQNGEEVCYSNDGDLIIWQVWKFSDSSRIGVTFNKHGATSVQFPDRDNSSEWWMEIRYWLSLGMRLFSTH